MTKGILGVVLDIEGTTTPVRFVYDVLFPYARQRLDSFMRESARAPEFIALLHNEWRSEQAAERPAAPSDIPSAVMYLKWLMDRDRKSPVLKLAQGMIWEGGYADGTLRSVVYPDVPVAMHRWRDSGLKLAIYSSGSVLAQQLIFANSDHGDLTPMIDAYFDTAVGAKQSSLSYARIAELMALPPATLLFVTDVAGEADAARAAGWEALLCDRNGATKAVAIVSFDDIKLA